MQIRTSILNFLRGTQPSCTVVPNESLNEHFKLYSERRHTHMLLFLFLRQRNISIYATLSEGWKGNHTLRPFPFRLTYGSGIEFIAFHAARTTPEADDTNARILLPFLWPSSFSLSAPWPTALVILEIYGVRRAPTVARSGTSGISFRGILLNDLRAAQMLDVFIKNFNRTSVRFWIHCGYYKIFYFFEHRKTLSLSFTLAFEISKCFLSYLWVKVLLILSIVYNE